MFGPIKHILGDIWNLGGPYITTLYYFTKAEHVPPYLSPNRSPKKNGCHAFFQPFFEPISTILRSFQ